MEGSKCLPTQVKLRALYRIWAGEKITRVARDCGISRQVIYIWKRKAEKALCRALKEKRRGPKICSLPQRPEIEEAQNETEEPFPELEKIQQEMETFQENSSSLGSPDTFQIIRNNGRKPQRCPVCGCEKVYKNGTYVRKTQNKRHIRKRVVQRYICAWCKNSVF